MQKTAHAHRQHQQHENAYQRFIDSLNRSQQTKEKYTKEFSYYLKWLGYKTNTVVAVANAANNLISASSNAVPANVPPF
jgi:hypothetical protein